MHNGDLSTFCPNTVVNGVRPRSCNSIDLKIIERLWARMNPVGVLCKLDPLHCARPVSSGSAEYTHILIWVTSLHKRWNSILNMFLLSYYITSWKQDSIEMISDIIIAPPSRYMYIEYHQISNTWRTKSQNLDASRLVLQFSLCNILKTGVKSRMKM